MYHKRKPRVKPFISDAIQMSLSRNVSFAQRKTRALSLAAPRKYTRKRNPAKTKCPA